MPNRINVLIFGSSGAGKSTLVNTVCDRDVAHAADTPTGVTEAFSHFTCDVDGVTFQFTDTAGLNETLEGTVDNERSARQLKTLSRSKFNVGVYVTRTPRLLEHDEDNLRMFAVDIFPGLPVVVHVNDVYRDETKQQEWKNRNWTGLKGRIDPRVPLVDVFAGTMHVPSDSQLGSIMRSRNVDTRKRFARMLRDSATQKPISANQRIILGLWNKYIVPVIDKRARQPTSSGAWDQSEWYSHVLSKRKEYVNAKAEMEGMKRQIAEIDEAVRQAGKTVRGQIEQAYGDCIARYVSGGGLLGKVRRALKARLDSGYGEQRREILGIRKSLKIASRGHASSREKFQKYIPADYDDVMSEYRTMRGHLKCLRSAIHIISSRRPEA